VAKHIINNFFYCRVLVDLGTDSLLKFWYHFSDAEISFLGNCSDFSGIFGDGGVVLLLGVNFMADFN
jgi:hypothetical protein